MERIRHCAQGVWCSLAVTSADPPLPETQFPQLLHKVAGSDAPRASF